MNKDLTTIRTNSKNLSPKLQKIAEYIIENPQKVIHSSITELAEIMNCSETTVFRLCKELQFKGFQDLKISIAKDTTDIPIQNIYEEISPEDTPIKIFTKVFQSHIKGFQDTLHLINEETIEQAILLLAQATRIEFFGSGGSSIIALDAYHKFMRTGIPCAAHVDSHFQAMSASILSEKSAIVAISHSGRNKSLIDTLKLAKEKNITIIAITSYLKSPLSKLANLTLYTPTNEVRFRSEATSSRLAQLGLIDALYVGVSLQHQEKTLHNIQNIRKAISTQRL